MKKIALYLVLLLGLGIYAACDGGGDNDNNPGEECDNPITSTAITIPYNNSSNIAAVTDLYFSFSVPSDGNYTISLTGMVNNVDWTLYESSPTCLDDKVDVLGGFSNNAGSANDIKTVNNLKATTKYLLRLHSSGSATIYTLDIQAE